MSESMKWQSYRVGYLYRPQIQLSPCLTGLYGLPFSRWRNVVTETISTDWMW